MQHVGVLEQLWVWYLNQNIRFSLKLLLQKQNLSCYTCTYKLKRHTHAMFSNWFHWRWRSRKWKGKRLEQRLDVCHNISIFLLNTGKRVHCDFADTGFLTRWNCSPSYFTAESTAETKYINRGGIHGHSNCLFT